MKLIENQLIKKCVKVADGAADASGFVAISKLAKICGCEILIRPLLVEAGVGRRSNVSDGWVVLLNSEIHDLSSDDLKNETTCNKLGVRVRNTLSHEIAHAIAYNLFGLDVGDGASSDERVASVERMVEKISPLLIVPANDLLSKLSNVGNSHEAVGQFSCIRESYGVSHEAFIACLNTYRDIFITKFATLEEFSRSFWGVAHCSGKTDFEINKFFTFRNYANNPFSNLFSSIEKKIKSLWSIVDVQPLDKGFRCLVVNSNIEGFEIKALIDLESLPYKSGEKVFFRIPQKQPEF